MMNLFTFSAFALLALSGVNGLTEIAIDGKGPFSAQVKDCSNIKFTSNTQRDLYLDLGSLETPACQTNLEDAFQVSDDLLNSPYTSRFSSGKYFFSSLNPDDCETNSLYTNITFLNELEMGYIKTNFGSCITEVTTSVLISSASINGDIFQDTVTSQELTFEFDLRRTRLNNSTWLLTSNGLLVLSATVSTNAAIFCLQTDTYDCISTSLTTGNPNHYAFTFGSGKMSLFINGLLRREITNKTGLFALTTNNLFQFTANLAEIANVRLWSTRRSNQDILQSRRYIVSPLNSGLLGNWISAYHASSNTVNPSFPLVSSLTNTLSGSFTRFVACPINYYRDPITAQATSSDCLSCPPNSDSLESSESIDDCLCFAGFYRANSLCPPCEVNTFKSTKGPQACTPCPSIKTTNGLTGAFTISQCLCPKGYKDEGDCIVCPAGEYQDELGQNSCKQCPLNSVSMSNSDSIDDCLCSPGFRRDGSACDACPINTFKNTTGNVECSSCPSDSSTNSLTGQTDCICNFGFSKKDSVCISCEQNNFMGSGCTLQPPTGLNIGTKNGTTIQVRWTMAANANWVNVYYQISGSPTMIKANGAIITGTSFRIVGLTPQTTYVITVRSGTGKTYEEPVGATIISQTNGVELLSCEATGAYPTTDIGKTAIIYQCPSNSYGFTSRACNQGGVWATAVQNCTNCPSNSSSPANSDTISDCVCNNGFTFSGNSCIDVNECLTNICSSEINSYCVNSVGSYSCDCIPGFGTTPPCSADAKTTFLSGFNPILRHLFDGVNIDSSPSQVTFNLGTNNFAKFYRKGSPNNQAIQINLGSRIISSAKVLVTNNFTMEVVFNPTTMASFDLFSLTSTNSGNRTLATFRVSGTTNGKIQFLSGTTSLGTSPIVFKAGRTVDLVVSVRTGKVIAWLDDLHLGTFDFNLPQGSYFVQSGAGMQGFIDELGLYLRPTFSTSVGGFNDFIACDNSCTAPQVCFNSPTGFACGDP